MVQFFSCLTIRRYLFFSFPDLVSDSNLPFSTPHRRSWRPAAVQRYTGTFMPENWAGGLGRSHILFYGGQGFISPTRELPRSEGTNTLFFKMIITCKWRAMKMTPFYSDFSLHGKHLSRNNSQPHWKILMSCLYTTGSRVHPLYTWYWAKLGKQVKPDFS